LIVIVSCLVKQAPGASKLVLYELCIYHFYSEKAYDVTYIILRFRSPRPASFAIYKKATENGDWIPFQFYSSSCQSTYGKVDSSTVWNAVSRDDQAACTSANTDISPMTGGSVSFSTLVGRPSAFNFDNSPVLQVCVTQDTVIPTFIRDSCVVF
jgi:coxsackievirus/adenovirus receptor